LNRRGFSRLFRGTQNEDHHRQNNLRPQVGLTPAMQAGITNHVWELKEIIELLDFAQQAAA
jgi:hypothetical protein